MGRSKRFLICCLCALSACAPGFGERVNVEELIAIADPTPGSPPAGERWVRVNQFTDNRPAEELVRVDGRAVQPEGLVAVRVSRAFQDLLRLRGYRVSQFHGVLLQGEVTQWVVDVSPEFPLSRAKASAAVRISALADNGRPLYAATYYGDAELSHPFLREGRVKTLLGTAMETALEGALKDQALRSAIGY